MFNSGGVWRVVPCLGVMALAGACPPPNPPPPSTVSVSANFALDMPVDARAAPTTFTFEIFAGAATTSLSVGLDIQNLGPGTTITVLDGGGGNATPVPLGTLPAAVTPAVAGNVAILRVSVPPLIIPPRIRVLALNQTRAPAPFFPAVAARAPRMNAFALTPGQPVDMVFTTERTSPGAPVETFFFSVSGLGTAPFDVVLFGGGAARVSDPETQGFPITKGSSVVASLPAPRDAALLLPESQLTRFAGGRGSLVMAISNDDIVQPEGIRDSRHVRLVVLPVGAAQALSFPSPSVTPFLPVPIGVDVDVGNDFGNDKSRIGACTNWQGISPEVLITADGITVTTPLGTVGLPPVTAGAPIPPVCYDGHPGTDFSLAASFAGQAAGVAVTAAAAGTVVSVREGLADTCFADPRAGFAVVCPDQTAPLDANAVVIRQDDGLFAMYLHLRTGSVVVMPGDRVVCGDRLGMVGSSGDSSGPHIHFELRAPAGSIDPQSNLSWQSVRMLSPPTDPYGPGGGRWRLVTGNALPAPLCP
jgi:hypothetical protein